MKNETQNNIAKITGRVFEDLTFSHEIEGEKFFETVLEVKRLSDTFDYIPITISERTVNGEKIEKNQIVSISGEYRSYNKMQDEKSKLILHVFAKDVKIDPNMIEDESENSVHLTGFICKPPIFRVTPFKREICDALIAVNRKNIKSDYIPCIFWGRNARFLQDKPVGTKIEIEGRIQSRSYTKTLSNGEQIEKVAYEISVGKLCECELENLTDKTSTLKTYLDQNSPAVEMARE